MKLIIGILAGIGIHIIITKSGIYLEKKRFNSGKCLLCNKPLSQGFIDSQGGRNYCCKSCHYTTRVSYNIIDKNYLKRLKLKERGRNHD